MANLNPDTRFHRGRRFMARPLLLVWLWLAFTAGLGAAPWWNKEWTGRLPITVDTTADGLRMEAVPGPIPVLLRLHGGNSPFEGLGPGGSAIRLIADDHTTVLPYQIEKFDDLLQEAFVWVLLPSIPENGKLRFWLYHGNPSVSQRSLTTPPFPADTQLVYHFSERESPPLDSSGKGNHAENAGLTVEGSLIGGGLRFTGRQQVVVPPSDSLTWRAGEPLTLSLWVFPERLGDRDAIISRAGADGSFELGLDQGLPYVALRNGEQITRVLGREPLEMQSWYHLAVVSEGGQVLLYVDGEVHGAASVSLPTLDGPVVIGRGASPASGAFVGQLDELVISRARRPQAYLAFSAVNQGTLPEAARLLRFEDGQAGGGDTSWLPGVGYMGTIAKTLSTDGWTVIAILACMSVFSWIVMILKGLHLGNVARSNRQFIRLWRHVATDLAVLDNPKAMEDHGGDLSREQIQSLRRSPMFRLYHTGVQEIRNRLHDGRRGGKKLSGISIQAIRASMDGVYLREAQSLNARIVYLTLSIAGGPFLGLLGTVLGVTITFAAIAASGDVNVNSIAPGVAAALTTTIAGLCVAIPALFGYNYLVSRIKEMTADMRVFCDEFITKAAEFYSKRPAGAGMKEESEEEEAGEEALVELAVGKIGPKQRELGQASSSPDAAGRAKAETK